MNRICPILLILALTVFSAPAGAQQPPAASSTTTTNVDSKAPANPPAPVSAASPAAVADAASDSGIPVGTVITMQNWQQYKQYMSDGVADLFAGKYYWKMPADVSMEVG